MKFLLNILFLTHVLALDNEWWKHFTMYEIYTPSFKDTNGNGYGDMKGIMSKLDYLKDLGVDVIWSTSFHPSPMLDNGYDVSDYMGINPLFGTMAHFDALMKQLKKKGMKLMMDFVPNHSSNKHEWFEKSVLKQNPYTDYYVWRDPKGYDAMGRPITPNNWLSVFGSSAWTWNEKRKQFYYHVFLPEQPDLNLRSPAVKNEMKNILKFWSNKGVAGFRLDAAAWLMEDQSYEDEEILDHAIHKKIIRYEDLKHDKTFNIADTREYIYDLRAYINELSAKINTYERILVPVGWDNIEDMKLIYGSESRLGAHFCLNYETLNNASYIASPKKLLLRIKFWLMAVEEKSTAVSNWALDSHDMIRASEKFYQEYVQLLLAAMALLPGVTTLYYGQEIGMTSGLIPSHKARLPGMYARTPMQWDSSKNAGFSRSLQTWLTVNPDYWIRNVKIQKAQPHSTYNFLKSLLHLKKTETMKYGQYREYFLLKSVCAFQRYHEKERYIVMLNLAPNWTTVELFNSRHPFLSISGIVEVHLSSPNSGLKKGTKINTTKKPTLVMNPMSVIVFFQHVEESNS